MAIAKYTLIYSMLAEIKPKAAAAAAVALSVLAISKRVKGAAAEWVPLWPCVLLQVGVLIGEEVLVREGSVVAQAGIVRV